ncbi:unnamed protein product [Phytomonas sp. Hart1]|nr:unnamed protein product [Phytomonas sp. Hart1]|eukprot:CCW69636.1 unnamed protein product [Phytomonas sp. isolate Hart1]
MQLSVQYHNEPITLSGTTFSSAAPLPQHCLFLAKGTTQLSISPIEWKDNGSTSSSPSVKPTKRVEKNITLTAGTYKSNEELDEEALEFFSE